MNLGQTDSSESKPGFTSFKKSIITLLFLFMHYSCYQIPEEKGDCILYCNPAECLILDEEKCECYTDFDCVHEYGHSIELGVDFGDCRCKLEDGGIWCSALTGDSIKTWKFVCLYDTIRNDTIINVFPYIYDCPTDLYQYRLDHIYIRCWGDDNCFSYDPDLYLWEFDDMIQPTKIIYTRSWRSNYDISFEYERKIIKLNPDTLITTYYEGQFPGWITLVAVED